MNNRLKKENGKPINVKTIKFNGIAVDIVAKSDFAAIIGMSHRKVEDWIVRGIILPPTFKDTTNSVKDWEGNSVPRKYYTYLEAVSLRRLLKDKVFAQRKPIPPDLIEEIHSSMEHIRSNLKVLGEDVLNHPITLEFGNFAELRDWMDAVLEEAYKKHIDESGVLDVNEICKDIYKAGDKLIKIGGCKEDGE